MKNLETTALLFGSCVSMAAAGREEFLRSIGDQGLAATVRSLLEADARAERTGFLRSQAG